MKDNDPFEKCVRRQPLRQIPPAWREEILAQARVAARLDRQAVTEETISEDQAALIAGWRLLFARLPLAWASLAALWIALIGVNLMMPASIVSVRVQSLAVVRMADLAVLDSSAGEFEPAILPQTPGSTIMPAARPSGVPVRRPRSERRPALDFGEAMPSFRFGDLV